MPKCSKCPFFMKIKEAFKKLKSKFRNDPTEDAVDAVDALDTVEDFCERCNESH